jgi:hypothetical protein
MANQNGNQPQMSQQQMMSLLCLAIYRMGGEFVLDLNELKGAMLVPSIQPIQGEKTQVTLVVDKYVKEERPDNEPGTE